MAKTWSFKLGVPLFDEYQPHILPFPVRYELLKYQPAYERAFMYVLMGMIFTGFVIQAADFLRPGSAAVVDYVEWITLPISFVALSLSIRGLYFARRYNIYQACMFLYIKRWGNNVPDGIVDHFWKVGCINGPKFWRKVKL
jgi:hypothetical protein